MAPKNTASETPAVPTFKFTDEQIREAVAKRQAQKDKAKAFRLTPEGKAKQKAQQAKARAKRDAMRAHAKKLGLEL